MKKLLLLASFYILFALYAPAQTVSGTVRDASTGETMPYVSIGLMGKAIGTVSDSGGAYSFPAEPDYLSDTVRFSYIGYRPYDTTVAALLEPGAGEVTLERLEMVINKITVHPAEYKRKTLGNTHKKSMMSLTALPETRGFELGVIMKIKKRALLENVTINITSCTYDDMIYRLNIYEMKYDLVGQNILTEPIYAYCPRTDEPMSLEIDLEKYDIVTDGDIFIVFEHIDDGNEGSLIFPASLTGDRTLARKASQAKWEPLPMKFRIPISITALVEK